MIYKTNSQTKGKNNKQRKGNSSAESRNWNIFMLGRPLVHCVTLPITHLTIEIIISKACNVSKLDFSSMLLFVLFPAREHVYRLSLNLLMRTF